jgi:hypothetical protein
MGEMCLEHTWASWQESPRPPSTPAHCIVAGETASPPPMSPPTPKSVYTNTGTDGQTPIAGFLMRPRPARPELTHQTCTRRAGVTCAARARAPASAADHDRLPVRGPASPTRTATEATCPHSCRFMGPRPLARLSGHWPGHRATGPQHETSVRGMLHAGTQPVRRRGPARPACGPGSTVQLPTSGNPRGCFLRLTSCALLGVPAAGAAARLWRSGPLCRPS